MTCMTIEYYVCGIVSASNGCTNMEIEICLIGYMSAAFMSDYLG